MRQLISYTECNGIIASAYVYVILAMYQFSHAARRLSTRGVKSRPQNAQIYISECLWYKEYIELLIVFEIVSQGHVNAGTQYLVSQ